jgi:serine/threonine protein kinase
MGYLTGFHVNIIQLMGCFTAKLLSDGFVYVFVEYCPYGDLKNWLKKNNNRYIKSGDSKKSMFNELKKKYTRPVTSKLDFRMTKLDDSMNNSLLSSSATAADFDVNKLPFNDDDLTFFCYEIAKGMEFLERKKFIHRDLAARNILLGAHFECKISDFGLADESKLDSVAFYGGVNVSFFFNSTF